MNAYIHMTALGLNMKFSRITSTIFLASQKRIINALNYLYSILPFNVFKQHFRSTLLKCGLKYKNQSNMNVFFTFFFFHRIYVFSCIWWFFFFFFKQLKFLNIFSKMFYTIQCVSICCMVHFLLTVKLKKKWIKVKIFKAI